MSQSLSVILQSHSKSDNQVQMGFYDSATRYCGEPKRVVTEVCTRSLAATVKNLKSTYPDAWISFHVIDDHSDQEVVEHLSNLCKDLNNSGIEATFQMLQGHGLLASCREQYQYGRNHGHNLVYFAQDDYLYYPNALQLMVEHHTWASQMTGSPVCIYPFNDPYRYTITNTQVPCYLVQGADRHWRTSIATACPFMISHEQLVEHWDLFEAFYNHPINAKMEDESINRLFSERGLVLMTPIPSLALHMQYESERDPYLDWESLWRMYK